VIRRALAFLGWVARCYPAVLRVGVAQAVAYRAEFIVWMLTSTLPLVMLAIWSAVARDAPVGRFGQREFTAYYLATVAVRQLTGTWLVWELAYDIRQGQLASKLLRPMHPLLWYGAENFGALPLRFLIVVPVLAGGALMGGAELAPRDPLLWALLPLALLGAWAITFFVMAVIGTLTFWLESSLSIFDLWFGLYTLLSGYLIPIELLPPWVRALVRVLPFRSTLGFPVELLIGQLGREAALADLARQWAWVLAMALVATVVWRRGIRRFEAYGA
jgi:ABC-2 type transport system permease protein